MKKLNACVVFCIYPAACFAQNGTEAPPNSPEHGASGFQASPPPASPTNEIAELHLGYSAFGYEVSPPPNTPTSEISEFPLGYSDSGYDVSPPDNTPTNEIVELPLGYSASYEHLHGLAYQSSLQQTVITYIVVGYSAPSNTPEESDLFESDGYLGPLNSPEGSDLFENNGHFVPPNTAEELELFEYNEQLEPPNAPEFSIEDEHHQCCYGCFCFCFFKRWFHW